MLIALLTILFLGGASPDSPVLDYIGDTKKNVATVIVDFERRENVSSTLKAAKKRTSEYSTAARPIAKQMEKALTLHVASETGMNAALDEYFSVRNAYNIDMINLRADLKEQVSREEWQALFGQPDEE